MLFGHTYDIRAEIELENGERYKVRCPIIGRFVTQEDILNAFKKEVEWKLGSPLKRIISMYDANNL